MACEESRTSLETLREGSLLLVPRTGASSQSCVVIKDKQLGTQTQGPDFWKSRPLPLWPGKV